MSQKDNYLAAEWTTLLRVLLDTATTVMLASPGGLVGESIAVVQAFGEIQKNYPDVVFIQSLIDNLLHPSPEENDALQARAQEGRSFDEAKQHYLASLRQARFILAEKATPAEGEAFKQVVVYLAERVAQASKEGGFLGIGGTRYTETEQGLVADIKEVLGIA